MSEHDIHIRIDGGNALITGETEEGVEFIDGWMKGQYTVQDSGSIIIPDDDDLEVFVAQAKREGLGVVQ